MAFGMRDAALLSTMVGCLAEQKGLIVRGGVRRGPPPAGGHG